MQIVISNHFVIFHFTRIIYAKKLNRKIFCQNMKKNNSKVLFVLLTLQKWYLSCWCRILCISSSNPVWNMNIYIGNNNIIRLVWGAGLSQLLVWGAGMSQLQVVFFWKLFIIQNYKGLSNTMKISNVLFNTGIKFTYQRLPSTRKKIHDATEL